MRIADLVDDLARVPGSVEGRCYDCREPVTIGPQSDAQLRRHRGASRVLCTVCVFAALAKEDPDRKVEVRGTPDRPRGPSPLSTGTLTARQLAEEIDDAGLST
jgi:hypothetical protein